MFVLQVLVGRAGYLAGYLWLQGLGVETLSQRQVTTKSWKYHYIESSCQRACIFCDGIFNLPRDLY